jgi:hypothetical protein
VTGGLVVDEPYTFTDPVEIGSVTGRFLRLKVISP